MLAGLALLVLVIGIPVALVILSGPPPFPTGWPTRESLTEPIGVDTLITVLTVVVWLAWLHFVLCVVAEFANAVRGRGVPRPIPLGGAAQRLARVLVSALIVTGIAAGQAAAGTGSSGPVEPASQAVITHSTTDFRAGVDADGGPLQTAGREPVRR